MDSKTAEASIKRLDNEINKLPESTDKAAGPPGGFKKLWFQVAAGIAVIAGVRASMRKLVNAVIDVTREAIHQESVITQLEARLKSTKGAAGLTKDELLKMASGLQAVTTYGDETVVEAENLLLTFTNIGRKVFPEALETVLDMSTALGQDLKSSAIQLGKALQDPILGVTALRRVGVNFTESQQEQIKVLVESGNALDAQKLILQELQTEFGGASKAAAIDFGGSLKQLSSYWGDLKEDVGKAIIENKTIKNTIKELKDEIIILIETGKIKEWANNAANAIIGLTSTLKEFGATLTSTKSPLGHVADGLAELYMNYYGIESPAQEFNRIEKEARLRAIEFKDSLKVLSPTMDEIREQFEKGKERATEWMEGIKKADEEAYAFKETIRELSEWWKKTNKLWEEAHPIIKTSTELIETQTDVIKGVAVSLGYYEVGIAKISDVLKNAQPELKDFYETASEGPRDMTLVLQNALPVMESYVFEYKQSWLESLQDILIANQALFDAIYMYAEYFIGQIDAISHQYYKNQMIQIDNLEQRQTESLDFWYQQQKDRIEQTIMDEEEKKEALEDLEEEYNARMDELQTSMEEKARAAKREAAEHDKAVALMAAIVNVAQAVTKTYASVPFPFNIPLAAAIAALGAIQIAAIKAQPIPLARGAIFERPTYLVGEAGSEALIGVTPLVTEIRKTIHEEVHRSYRSSSRSPVVHVYIGNERFKNFTVKTVEREADLGNLHLPQKAIRQK